MSESLTQIEFDARFAAGELALTLVGMSNVGKSHWSTELEVGAGFGRMCCDDLIEAELGDVLRELGFSGGISDMATWMGQPYDPQFAETQRTYLDLETGVMESILGQLIGKTLQANTVIDTTGSVVHTNPTIHRRLVEQTTVVYLEATADMRQKMFELYIANPKPVIWQHLYVPYDGERPKSALARCYADLLDFRSERYRQMAHITISRDVSCNISEAGEFLEYLRTALPATAE